MKYIILPLCHRKNSGNVVSNFCYSAFLAKIEALSTGQPDSFRNLLSNLKDSQHTVLFRYIRNHTTTRRARQHCFWVQLSKRHVVCQCTSKPLSVKVTGSQR
jgi:hypothetical protein